jgi:hypothetical protein
VSRKKKRLVTDTELLRVIDCKCIKCGAPARIFPPSPGAKEGVCVCPKCSPFWLGKFEEWKFERATAK